MSKYSLFPTDFNEDDYICENDLKRVIQRLCGEQRLSDENVNALIQKVKPDLFLSVVLKALI